MREEPLLQHPGGQPDEVLGTRQRGRWGTYVFGHGPTVGAKARAGTGSGPAALRGRDPGGIRLTISAVDVGRLQGRDGDCGFAARVLQCRA
ncbi:hypothetical protein GCM10010341_86090 [Streptomyces noursei]|nr:hypothetical protein GCM10010341_86090 [Streptomyces noursei]